MRKFIVVGTTGTISDKQLTESEAMSWLCQFGTKYNISLVELVPVKIVTKKEIVPCAAM
jgi:hypothetical protein